jgi:hypothetical protein
MWYTAEVFLILKVVDEVHDLQHIEVQLEHIAYKDLVRAYTRSGLGLRPFYHRFIACCLRFAVARRPSANNGQIVHFRLAPLRRGRRRQIEVLEQSI